MREARRTRCPARFSHLCLLFLHRFHDLFQHVVGLRAQDEVFVVEDEGGNGIDAVFVGLPDILLHLSFVGGICQHSRGEMIGVQANAAGNLLEDIGVADIFALLPVGAHDGIVEGVALALRLSIFLGDQRRFAVRLQGAGIDLDAVLLLCPLLERRARGFDALFVLRWQPRAGWPQLKRVPVNIDLKVLL